MQNQQLVLCWQRLCIVCSVGSGVIPSVSTCLRAFDPWEVWGFLQHPTWPLPHPWSTGRVPVAGITGGAKGCRLAPASRLIIREKPGSHPSRLTQSLQKGTPPFRCSLYSQVLLTWQPSLLFSNLGPRLGSTTLHFFLPNPLACHCPLVHANRCRLWPNSVSPSSPSTRVHIPGATRPKNRGYGWPRDWTQDLSDESLAPYRSELSGQPKLSGQPAYVLSLSPIK